MNQRTAKTLSGFLLLGFLLLTGCRAGGDPESPVPLPPAKKGEFCGGIAGFPCEKGLTCEYKETYPDAGGTCV